MSTVKALRRNKLSKKSPYSLIEYIDTIGNRRFKILHKDNLPSGVYRSIVSGSFNYCKDHMIQTWGVDLTVAVEECSIVPYLVRKK